VGGDDVLADVMRMGGERSRKVPSNETQSLGLILLAIGLAVALLGVLLWVGGRLGLGSLPGDLRLRGEGWSCFLPITTSILLSLLITLLFNLLFRWWRH